MQMWLYSLKNSEIIFLCYFFSPDSIYNLFRIYFSRFFGRFCLYLTAEDLISGNHLFICLVCIDDQVMELALRLE
ncbi:hypothetical protein Hdeb2414_s0184g00826441 [Helianthus debilis subsp. tardiflorus]